MARPSNTEVMKREDAALAVSAPPAELLGSFIEDGAKGASFNAEDIKIPRIVLLQQMSPEVTDGHAKYVEGARPGMFYNTVTKELYAGSTGIVMVPVYYSKTWGEWIPRDAGGGLVTVHDDKASALRDQRKDIVTELVETANHYVMIQTPTGWQPALLNFTKTKLSVSREWNTLIATTAIQRPDGSKATPPSFARLYRLSSALVTNNKGNFYNIVVTPMGWVDRPSYDEGKSYHELVASGELAARREDLAGGDVAEEVAGDNGNPSF
jgi:hypothetical protein